MTRAVRACQLEKAADTIYAGKIKKMQEDINAILETIVILKSKIEELEKGPKLIKGEEVK
ncbi:MAG TPA: hypothetical protein VMV86_05750 [Methanosarcinales archaeon]|nr:hypothetical protein [Methanosarcinales archaeon]